MQGDTDRDTASIMPVSRNGPELETHLAHVRSEESKRERLQRRIRQERRVLIPLLLIALLAWPNFGTAKVIGRSMQPTLQPDDTLIVLKTFRYLSPIHIGDVVVVRMKHGKLKGEDLVKRVAFIQNAAGNAPWPTRHMAGKRDVPFAFLFPEQVSGREPIPGNRILVLGDNLMNSMDSRDFGPVSSYEIIGKVIYSYHP